MPGTFGTHKKFASKKDRQNKKKPFQQKPAAPAKQIKVVTKLAANPHNNPLKR